MNATLISAPLPEFNVRFISHSPEVHLRSISCEEMISIVIPVLNEESCLADCLASLASQDYDGEYERIVADNGSTDGSVGVSRKFGVRVVSCSEKKSVFHARQAGADAARGDIVVQALSIVFEKLRAKGYQFLTVPELLGLPGYIGITL